MRKDDILLNEAYKQVHSQEPVDEAFNVTRARLAGVGGAVKGLKNRVVGGLQSGVGKMGAKAAGIDPSQAPTYQRGQDKVQAGKDAGKNAKVDSILKNQTQDINKFASKLTNQLVKLGLGNTATVSDIAGGMTDKLKEILKKEAPASNQLNAGSPTPAPATPAAAPSPAPAPAAAPAPSTTRASFSSGPTDQELADLDDSISNPTSATTQTAAPVASNPSQPPVQQTNTAAQAADAMKAADAGTITPTPETEEQSSTSEPQETQNVDVDTKGPEQTPEDAKKEFLASKERRFTLPNNPSANLPPALPEPQTNTETPAVADANASQGVTVSPEQAESSAAAEAAEEEIPENDPKPKAGGPNQSIYKNKKGKTFKYIPTKFKDKKTGKIINGRAWWDGKFAKDGRTKLFLAPAAQEATTQMWVLQQKELQQKAAQAPQQNESFRSFFWKS